MKLKQLVSEIKVEKIMGNLDINIEGLTYDSQKVKKEYLFVAIRGFKEDGHQFIPEAIKRGAKAIVIEREIDSHLLMPKIVMIKVASSRLALARLSACFYGFPSQKLRVIGITGTNGKTTLAYLLESIFKTSGLKVGKLSTIDYSIGDRVYPSYITTPESQDLQRMLRIMVDQEFDYVVMEVSSHSLVLHRTEGVEFDQAVFTNLSSEHLDFHHSLSNYLKAKTSLFRQLGKKAKKKSSKIAIINIDDPVADYIISNTSVKVVTYGIKKISTIQGKILKTGLNGTSFLVETKEGKRGGINLALLGIHNVYNALAAVSVALEEGIDFPIIKKGLEKVKKIPGRLEIIENPRGFKIFVDYAHTPDGLEKILKTLRRISKGRLIVVFGCGGDRDAQKRPLMGKIALKLADYSIVTSDNPRSEGPEEIIAQIEEGIREVQGEKGKEYLTVVNRREAIRRALGMMRKGDTLIVAGKGHERVQIFKDRVVEFDDRKVIRELLSEE